jgi:DNA polymerase elongation subunit (family B)
MSYISAFMPRNKKGFIDGDEVHVWECVNHKNTLKKYPGIFEFYVEHASGEYTSIYGKTLKKFEFETYRDFTESRKHLLNRGIKLYESDISVDRKVLAKHYYDMREHAPDINLTLYDLEIDYCSISYTDETLSIKIRKGGKEATTTLGDFRELEYDDQASFEIYDTTLKRWVPYLKSRYTYTGPAGFGSPEDPHSPISAISLHHHWLNKSVVLAVPPKDWDGVFDESLRELTDVRLFDNEKDLLLTFLDEIEDTNVLSGWNSSMFDDPYITKRLEIVLGEYYSNKMSFKNAPKPQYKDVELFGRINKTVTLFGRVNIDYLEIFKKFEFYERPSYRLANIADEILPDLPKLSYEGTLEQLYHNDFNHFVRYNIRDTEILAGFENTLGYIDSANKLCHSVTAQFSDVMGTIRVTDMGIINYCHYKANVIVPDKWEVPDGSIKGAFVLLPQRGMHEWVASIDINSLYPSAIRSLNISPEKLIGQFIGNAKDFVAIRNKEDKQISATFEDGVVSTKHVTEWIQWFKDMKYAVSAWGTIYDQNGMGILPTILTEQYAERKEMQKQLAFWKSEADKHPKGSAEYYDCKKKAVYYNRMQFIIKIRLNSTYGCLTNVHFRFFRLEAGESTTGVGRTICIHQAKMTAMLCDVASNYNVNFPLYDTVKDALERGYGPEVALHGPEFNGEFKSESVLASDTDSCYFKTHAADKAEAIAVAEHVAKIINDSFPGFMQDVFFCQPGFDNLIKTGVEVISDKCIWVMKKNYIMHLVYKDGKHVDEIKTMGLALKKTTIPKPIGDKLTTFVTRLLTGDEWDIISLDIVAYRDTLKYFSAADTLNVGLPKGIKGIEAYTKVFESDYNTRLPGHVAAAIHYNQCLIQYNDTNSNKIQSGDKIKVFYLKYKFGRFKSIALPTDMDIVPDWFITEYYDLIDKKLQLSKLVDSTLEGVLHAIGLEVPTAQLLHFNDLFNY